MDPNATLCEIEYLYMLKDYHEASYLASELNNWLRKGGFDPDWKQYPIGTLYYKNRYSDKGKIV